MTRGVADREVQRRLEANVHHRIVLADAAEHEFGM
jgi:hypothetical protein